MTMTSSLKPLWSHFKARAAAVLRNPAAWVVLVFFGVTGLVYWPAATSVEVAYASGLDTLDEGLPVVLVWMLWFWLWPMLPMVSVRGRATGEARSNPLAAVGAPALPVGPGARALAEAVLALLVLGAVRSVGLVWLHGSEGAHLVDTWLRGGQQPVSVAQVLGQTLGGAVILLPMALAWGLPASSINFFMWRPMAVAAIATGLHAVGGSLGTWPGVVSTGLVLSALVLASAHLEAPGWRPRIAVKEPGSRVRPARDPKAQLSRDAWLPITRTWGPWLAAAVILFAGALVIDIRGGGSRWAFFAGFEVFLIVGLQPLFRPFGNNLIAESLVGKHGAERGDFMRAWSVLPVSREAVLRRTWLHGLVVGLIVWAVPVGMLALRARIRLGTWGLYAADGGSLTELVILGAGVVPMMAGLMVAAALGRKLETAVSVLVTLVGIYTLLPVKILLTETFGNGPAAAIGLTVYFAVLVSAAALPPLRFLRHVPRIEALG